MLPSKTIPEVNNRKKQTRKPRPKVMATMTAPSKKRARACSVEVEEIEDEDSAPNIAARNSSISPTGSFEITNTKKVNVFYIQVLDVFVSSMFSEGSKCEKEPGLSLL
jgi:hypothetical protein